jgi:hypothetical protein
MTWRAVGSTGEPYPGWLRELTAASGVYAIRVRGLLGGWTVVYVGESHKGRLRKTITRHLQAWGRSKQWWKGFFGGSDADPGFTYPRDRCEVAVEVSRPDQAVRLQSKWIADLNPRDNVLATGEAPF